SKRCMRFTHALPEVHPKEEFVAHSHRRRRSSNFLRTMCVTSLLVGAAAAPNLVSPGRASAAGTCQSSVATYVETSPPGTYSAGTPTTLKKYIDWDPKGGGASGPIFDTGFSATVNATSRFTGAGQGIIYELTQSGELKSFKDNTATGGSLLTSVKS